MRRDDEYIREMLRRFEKSEDFHILVPNTLRATPEELKMRYHILLLSDAGYIVATNRNVYRVTSEGHDYLAAIQDDGIWKSTRKALAATGGNATMEIVKALATGYMKSKITKHTGIDL